MSREALTIVPITGADTMKQNSESYNSSGPFFFDAEDMDDDLDGCIDEDVTEAIDDAPMKIIDGLYIGSMLAEQNKAGLLAAGICAVLQVGEGLCPTYNHEFEYEGVGIMDVPDEDIVAHFAKCFKFIDEHVNAGGVLVHCVAGVSRSAAVCIGYLMWKQSMPLQQASSTVLMARPWIAPNPGFVKQLKEFEAQGCKPDRWRAWRHTCPEQPIVGQRFPG